MALDIEGHLGITWAKEGYWILIGPWKLSPFGLGLGQVGSVGRGLA